MTSGQNAVPVHLDIVLIRRARALATLGFTQAVRPVAAAVERSLAAKVAARMPRS